MADPKTYTQEELDAKLAELAAEKEALKANRDEALSEAKKAKSALKNYDGVDPAEYKTLKTAADEAARKAALAEGNLEVWKKQVTDAHQKERDGDQKRIDKLTRALERRLVDATLAESLAKADVDPTMLPLLKLEGRRYVRVKETDDDFEPLVADERGNALIADGKGTAMSVDDLVVQKLKAQYPGAFKGTGSSGGGAPKPGAGGGGANVIPAGDGAAFLASVGDISAGKKTVAVE